MTLAGMFVRCNLNEHFFVLCNFVFFHAPLKHRLVDSIVKQIYEYKLLVMARQRRDWKWKKIYILHLVNQKRLFKF